MTAIKRVMTARFLSSGRFIVPERRFLEIRGIDAIKFLQGICTNNVSKLKNHGDCIASAFLTPKGRILADACIYYVDGSGIIVKPFLVIEIHQSALSALTSYLATYKLRSKVRITPSNEYVTVLENHDISSADTSTQGNKLSLDGTKEILRVDDPRVASFGTRHLLRYVDERSEVGDKDASICEDIIQSKERDNFSTDASYHRLRLLYGLMEGPEISNRIPLECNLDLLNYIDFSKGCYVGQELTARTKFKGLVRKRVLPFLRSSQHPLFTSGKIGFSFVDQSFIEKFVSNTSPVEDGLITKRIGISYPPDQHQIAAGLEQQEAAGEIISEHSTSEIFCALVRLEKFLPKNPADEISACRVIDDESPVSIVEEDRKQGVPTASFVPIRPPFWLDIDPITRHRIDTHVD